MAKLSPTDFTIWLPINIDVNDGQNKYELDIISKNDAKIPYFWPKMGQLPLLCMTLNGHNLAIFHLILTFFF